MFHVVECEIVSPECDEWNPVFHVCAEGQPRVPQTIYVELELTFTFITQLTASIRRQLEVEYSEIFFIGFTSNRRLCRFICWVQGEAHEGVVCEYLQ